MTGNNGPEKFPYRFTHGNVENVGSLTKRQIDLIEAIIDGQLVEYVDGLRAGGSAFPRRSNGDGGMTLRDFFANDAPISLGQAIAIEYQADLPHMNDEERAKVFETLARMRYEYADAMLKERAK